MKVQSPTQRTLAYYRKQGWTIGVVEKWNNHIQCRQDLFGFADLFAFNDDEVLLIQATTGSHVSDRIKKILHNQNARKWLKSGRKIIVIGWRQLVAFKQNGEKAKLKRWTPKIVEVEL